MKNIFDELSELMESGEEFELNNWECSYRFKENILEYKTLCEGSIWRPTDIILRSILVKGIKRKPWVPEEGSTFYIITPTSDVVAIVNFKKDERNLGDSCISFGNYYLTRELAKSAAEKVRELLKGLPHE